MMKQRFKNKVMLITGAAGGIGLATALLAAQEGASVVFADTKEEDGQTALARLRKFSRAEFCRADLTDSSAAQSFVQRAAAEYGGVDILVNNAGITGPIGPVHKVDGDAFRRVFECNVMTMVNCSRYAVEHMLRRGGDRAIVNVSSVAGLLGFPGNAAYVASKHAVNGLTKCMALDYAAAGIRVNAVNPGVISTPMQQQALEQLRRRGQTLTNDAADKAAVPGKNLSPQNRVAEPEEVAAAILFLASAEASHVTGVTLPVDGGLTAY